MLWLNALIAAAVIGRSCGSGSDCEGSRTDSNAKPWTVATAIVAASIARASYHGATTTISPPYSASCLSIAGHQNR